MHKAGFVNIVGNPNVGKSTLMNALVGERISIATFKAQTTRHRIMGIYNTDDMQIVFSDTPGVLKPQYKLQESMLNFSTSALTDADVLLYVTDVVETPDKHNEFVEKVAHMEIPVLLLINKIDLSNQEKLVELVEAWKALLPNAEIIPISATTKFNVDYVMKRVKELLPDSPPYFDKDQLVLPVIVLFAILNCFTTYVFYEDYKYKMNLMTEIAAKEEFSGLDAVSELLKDKDIETNEQGRRLLEQYGYWGNKGNAFYMQFRHQVMVTGAVSTVICVLLLTFLLYWKKKEDACHQKILDQLEEILIRFRENKFDALLKTENPAELEKLNDQLEAIGHHIQLIKEEARAEKENTKEMVSDISHQLKTPVAALDTCFSVLMQNDLSATEQEEFRIRCRSALDGLETLLQSLLEISKMETGLIQINKKKLPLMDTVISAVNRTYPKADEKEIEFVFDYEKELETCTIMQDKRWLGEAVINVLDNAVKYSPCGSKIFIRLQKRNDLVRMEIEDQGIGIPQNEYHKIFQRFYRGSSKEVMEKSGTGIGLFLSREIIEKHAGTITVTSGKKKKGSTFVIQLPYVG